MGAFFGLLIAGMMISGALHDIQYAIEKYDAHRLMEKGFVEKPGEKWYSPSVWVRENCGGLKENGNPKEEIKEERWKNEN